MVTTTLCNTAGLALMKRQAANSLDEFAKAQDQAFRWGQAQPMWCTTFQEHMGGISMLAWRMLLKSIVLWLRLWQSTLALVIQRHGEK